MKKSEWGEWPEGYFAMDTVSPDTPDEELRTMYCGWCEGRLSDVKLSGCQHSPKQKGCQWARHLKPRGEAQERAELERLKRKYEPSSPTT